MIGERIVREQQPKMVKKIKNYIYDPQQVVGSGFSSKVFKGVNELTQETIAIKVLELSKIQSEVEKYLLNNEINALRALSHPHILRTVEVLMTKNNVYLMTEFCELGDLQQHIRKQGRLSEIQALRIIRDVADGYLAIEEKLIVHRDLKTANIFLTSSGARIADFGFCEFLSETKKPQLFYNVGSPAYMSPESYRENIYSAKSDVWSIGIILYEMLTGETPDKNLTYSQMSSNLISGRINSGPNEEIRHILSLCFKKDLKDRATPLQLLEMINNEIQRIEGPRIGRPQLVSTQNNAAKFGPSSSTHPIEVTPLRATSNRMVSSSIPGQQSGEGMNRGPSPIKARFNGIMFREQGGRNAQPSPVKFIERRFSKEEEVPLALNRIKSATQMLLFLYRVLNSLAQVAFNGSSCMRLILFRHRSYLQSFVERISQEDHLDRNSFDPLKEFHFLKVRFDDTYLQKQALQSSSHPTSSHQRIQQFANSPFNDLKSVQAHCLATLELASECENRLMSSFEENESNRVGIVLDYLLLHFQVLLLYGEGKSLDSVCQEFLQLPTLLKEQPRKLTPFHFALLRHKLKQCSRVLEQWRGEKQEEDESSGHKQLADIPERKALLINGFF